MKKIICVVRDRAADCFATPIFVPSRGMAVRGFMDEINREAAPSENPLYAHPEDFDLYELGTFDDCTGLFESGVPQMVAVGKDLKR